MHPCIGKMLQEHGLLVMLLEIYPEIWGGKLTMFIRRVLAEIIVL